MPNAFDASMIKSKLGWSNAFSPNAAFPLDIRQWFGSLEAAQAAANTAVEFGSSDSVYHFGMQLFVFDGTSASTYQIQGDKSLKEIGAAAPMLFVADEGEMLALVDITAGQQVYREDTHTIWLFKGNDPAFLVNWVESAAQNDTIWEGTSNKVLFHSMTMSTFRATQKNDNTLYFITDAGRIYKGAVDVTAAIEAVSALPEVADAVAGKLYFNSDSLELACTMDNATWMTLFPGYLTDGANWAEADGNKLATIALIKSGIQAAVDGISFEGYAHDITYDSTTGKLIIPITGKDNVEIDIAKEKFVKAGAFYPEYPVDNPQYYNVIVLELDQGDPVIIPAEALVNVYTADNTEGADVIVSITSDNKISARLSDGTRTTIAKIATIEAEIETMKGNIQANTDNIADKVDKVAGTENNLVSFGANGAISDTGKVAGGATISDTPDENTLATEAAVAAMMAWGTI